jgi:anti-anti-sigma regulatory factor
MTVTTQQVQGKVPVTILKVQGDLDASNYLDVIQKAQEAYNAGERDFLFDMGEIPFMASSGLVALHSMAMLVKGEKPPDPSEGWGAFRSLEREPKGVFEEHVKLLNPQPKVDRTLEMTGMKGFFEIFTDLDTAINSFG